MKNIGMNLPEVKKSNRLLLLQLICTAGATTRSELSLQSHLSSMTVTNIVNEFLEQNFIEEACLSDSVKVPGRTPMLLRLSSVSPVVIGIYITKSHLYGIVGDCSLNILEQKTTSFETVENENSILNKLLSMVQVLYASVCRPILGLGISVPGIVDQELGTVKYITDFYDIKHLNIKEFLAPHFAFPIFVGKDMDAAGLCELYFGYGQTMDSFLYVGLTYGLGASLITNHNLMDSCGEMGHMSIDCNGPKCSCGNNGCLELYVSTPNILRRIAEETGIRLTDMKQVVDLSVTNKIVYAILYSAIKRLCYGINNYLNLFTVSNIVLGHDACFLPDELITHMEDTVSKINISLHKKDVHPQFVKSKFSKNAALFGSICIVLRQLFQGVCPLDFNGISGNGTIQPMEKRIYDMRPPG